MTVSEQTNVKTSEQNIKITPCTEEEKSFAMNETIPGEMIIYLYVHGEKMAPREIVQKMLWKSNHLKEEWVREVQQMENKDNLLIFIKLTAEARNKLMKKTDLYVRYCEFLLPAFDLLSLNTRSILEQLITSDNAELAVHLLRDYGFCGRIFVDVVKETESASNFWVSETIYRNHRSINRYSISLQ